MSNMFVQRLSLPYTIAATLILAFFVIHYSHSNTGTGYYGSDDVGVEVGTPHNVSQDVNHFYTSPNGTLPITFLDAAPPVAVVSMTYGDPNDIYNRAIDTHIRHAERHGYPVHVLRRELINGVWNKLLWLLHILVLEMEKGERGARWLMWFDADSVLMNPALPLSIFLPPRDFGHVDFLASTDWNGLNAGMFFIRVNRWSLDVVTKALAVPYYLPEHELAFAEQTALWEVLSENQYKSNVLYQPRKWWNAYDFKHGHEGETGVMFGHFAGQGDDRWDEMTQWLEILEGPKQAQWEVPLASTAYPEQIDRYWGALRLGKSTLEEARQRMAVLGDNLPDTLRNAYEKLELHMGKKTDETEELLSVAQEVHELIEFYTNLRNAEPIASIPTEQARDDIETETTTEGEGDDTVADLGPLVVDIGEPPADNA